MSERGEIFKLRSKCRSLENQTKQLELTKSRVQSRLVKVQASLNCDNSSGISVADEIPTCCFHKNDDVGRVRRIKEQMRVEKLDTAVNLLKLRLQWELNQALQRQMRRNIGHHHQLNTNLFRSDLVVWGTQRKNQLATLLSYSTSQEKDNNKIITERRQWSSHHVWEDERGGHQQSNQKQQYQPQIIFGGGGAGSVAKLKKAFAKRTAKLLKDLNTKDRTIAQLQNFIIANKQEATKLAESSHNYQLEQGILTNGTENGGGGILQSSYSSSGGPVRYRIERNRWNTSRPYHLKKQKSLIKPPNYDAFIISKMNELDVSHHHHHGLDNRQQYFSLPNNLLSTYNNYAAFSQCGLETLPEASSEEESLTTVKDDAFPGDISSSSITSSSPSSFPSSSLSRRKSKSAASLDFSLELEGSSSIHGAGSGGSKILRRKCFEQFTSIANNEEEEEEECSNNKNGHKIFLLQSIIQQLRDELRECRDQNELLEFRLLEMEESPSSSPHHKQSTDDPVLPHDDEIRDSKTPSIGTPELPMDDTSTSPQEENHHAVATESRSSCSSDCSESLSLQESGIFDGQGSDDGLPSPRSGRSHISRELANLTFQIEELLRRYNEGSDPQQEKRLDKLDRSKLDVASDLSYCRQRIQEFEKRLSQMNDITYMRSLEDKVNLLLVDNKRLEEERTEIEEAENDNRYLCQRLEEKVKQLKKKKFTFQERLNLERENVESLKRQLIHLQSQNLTICSKIAKLEGLVQSYEQKNFELEESCMEMRCSADQVQFVLNAIPVISFVYFWQYLVCWGQTYLNHHHHPLHTNTNDNTNGRMMLSYISALEEEEEEDESTTLLFECLKSKTGRKHKLPFNALKESEPTEKKWKSVKERIFSAEERISKWKANEVGAGGGGGSCINNNNNRGNPFTCNNATQTSQAEEEKFVEQHQLVGRMQSSWNKMEESFHEKIDALNQTISTIEERFATERVQLMEMYEEKVGKKDAELKASLQCQEEMQEKWNIVTNELEQFASFLAGNVVLLGDEGILEMRNSYEELPLFSKMIIGEETTTCNHSSSSSSSIPPYSASVAGCAEEQQIMQTADVMAKLIPLLQSSLKEHLSRLEIRERHLISEIDRLLAEVKANAEQAESSVVVVTHLNQENARLQALLKDEKVWGDLKQMNEENERLRAEVGEKQGLLKRVEECQRNETELRERVEDYERVEERLQAQLALMKRKEVKGDEKVQQLIHELQFLRSKCCQLQDEVDSKGTNEVKYKTEMQCLAGKLRESMTELEKKEMQLENCENVLQTKIDELKTQLQELYQTYTDTECSNGMLTEEVSYLEKTVEEAMIKGNKSDNTITSLSHELKQKDSLIEDLQTQLRHLRLQQPSSSDPNCNELSDFNNCEGGLNGIVRAVQEAVSIIQRCDQCESVGFKLKDIADTLIPLIQILQSSPVTDFTCSTEPEFGMKRCESDEILIIPTASTFTTTNASAGEMVAAVALSQQRPSSDVHVVPQHLIDEDEILIARLQKTMNRLTLQITTLEETLNIRQAEMKESHVMETGLWKYRCKEKNVLIQLLARRIAHLSATDVEGHFINGILTEIRKLEQEFDKNSAPPEPRNTTTTRNEILASSSSLERRPTRKNETSAAIIIDFSFNTLRSFLASERQRVLELLESVSFGTIGESGVGDNHVSPDTETGSSGGGGEVGFHVVRKIGDDALLVSWTVPGRTDTFSSSGCGYEIAVNGSTYLKIPKANRHKAVLFGLNFEEPLRLTFKCPGDPSLEESTITFIS